MKTVITTLLVAALIGAWLALGQSLDAVTEGAENAPVNCKWIYGGDHNSGFLLDECSGAIYRVDAERSNVQRLPLVE